MANDHKRVELERVTTGVPRLDFILKGGLVEGNTYSIIGPPGSGKTILANQLCFHHIEDREDARCLYVTLLAEAHAKMLRHLETLDFFDPSCVSAERLVFVSAYQTLKKHGIPGVLSLLRKSIKQRRVTFLVIDGLQALARSATRAGELEEFLHDLQGFVSVLRCTTVLLSSAQAQATDAPEHVVVDGVLELSYRLVGPRAVRELTVHKFRGTDYLLGRHEVEITSGGVQVHPRTEVQFGEPPEHADEERLRMRFGIDRLDEMLNGGVLSGTATTLLGSPGTGKTMLGLSFLVEGARQGQHGLYFGFYEPPPRLIEKAERVGIPLGRYVKDGSIELLWQPPLEHFMDALAEQLLEKLRREKGGKRRLFIDGVEGFRAAAVYADRMPRFISALTNQLRMLDITTLVSEELDLFKPEVELPNPELATVNEAVILLRYLELKSQIFRLISILKMRESKYDTAIREFAITDQGVVVANSFDTAESILSGRGTLLHGHAPPSTKPPDSKRRRRPRAKGKGGRT